MNGRISREAFNLCNSWLGQNTFSESYDFTRCVRPNGSSYGTAGKCRKGTEKAKAEGSSQEMPRGRLTKTKINSLTEKQLNALIAHPKLYPYQREKLRAELERRKPDSGPPARVVKKQTPQIPVSKVTKEKVKKAFSNAVDTVEKVEKERQAIIARGASYDNPELYDVSRRLAKATAAITLLRQAYHAANPSEFLRESGEMQKLLAKSNAIREKAEKEAEEQGTNAWVLPNDHPLIKRIIESSRIQKEEAAIHKDRMTAAYYGEPSEVSKMSPEKGGKVDPSVPSNLPHGGADPKLKEFLDGAEVVMAFKPRGFSKFVKDGYAKNGFEPGTGGVKVGQPGYMSGRQGAEEEVLGLSASTDPKSRPVYGALEHPDRSRSLQGQGGLGSYGGIQVVFNNSVKDRATFTVGDSLDYNLARHIKASPVRDPANPVAGKGRNRPVEVSFPQGPQSTAMKVFTPSSDGGPHNPGYVEAQIFGGLRTADIREVRYYKGHEIPATTRRLLEKQGIRVVELPPKLDDLLIYADSPGYSKIETIEPEP